MLVENLTSAAPLIILCGVTGTFFMSQYAQSLGKLQQHVPPPARLLGTLITFSTRDRGRLSRQPAAVFVGLLCHYTVGVLFMASYYALWSLGVGKPAVVSWIWLSLGSGLIAILCWWIVLKVHPKPPRLNLTGYLVNIFSAHWIFVAGCMLSYLVATLYL